MSGIIPILILGAFILVLAGRLLVQQRAARPATLEDYVQARAALDSVFTETSAIRRIFASEDLEFILRTGTPGVQRFFLKERSMLAIQWLRTTQGHVARLMNLHLKLASYTTEPDSKLEFALSARYLGFKLTSNFLLILIRLRGPFEAVKITGYTLNVAEHFCSVFSLRLEKVDATRLGSV
jgi:hypothetical protein